MWVSGERRYAPVGDDNTDEHDGDRDRGAIACAPGVVEADVSDAVEAVVEGNEEERDVDGDEPGILEEAALDDFEREARGGAHFGGEVLDPEVHDEQHKQGGARDALQIPVDCSSRHESIPKLEPRRHDGHNERRRKSGGIDVRSTQSGRKEAEDTTEAEQ